MKKLIYINACMREESRTQRIAEPIVGELSSRYDIETIRLDKTDFKPIDRDVLRERNVDYFVPEDIVNISKRIAAADRIVIAAPFWDMSFPSILKVFLENVSLFNITFTADGSKCVGLCKCEKLMYITTRGMDIDTASDLEQATPYLKAISHLWGLGELTVISAQNMDFCSANECEMKIREAVERGVRVAGEW